jgi:hypothetical protein
MVGEMIGDERRVTYLNTSQCGCKAALAQMRGSWPFDSSCHFGTAMVFADVVDLKHTHTSGPQVL